MKNFGGKNIFHRNLDTDLKKNYQNFSLISFKPGGETGAYDTTSIADVLSEHLWSSRFYKIFDKPFIFYPFESVGINHVSDLFIDQHPIPWISVKSKFNLNEKLLFKWFQLVKVISNKWANITKTATGSTQDLNIQHKDGLSKTLNENKIRALTILIGTKFI